MTAVAANPCHLAFAVKDLALFDIFAQGTIALLVLSLNIAYLFEQNCDMLKAFFSGFLCKVCIHIGPLIVFSGCGILEIFHRVADSAAQELKPHLGVFFFVVRSLGEDGSNLLKAFLFCLRSIEGVFVSCLRFACKCSLEVFLGFGSL